ncbi:MAG: hypothetical protein M1826_001765 [Phylliscum demangeonii]|nr:MAG: hypothetical protein M1826_001765 [Phylliscum demangeonii]
MDDHDTKTRQRIVKHMNEAHEDSLSRFLEFYCRVPSSMIKHAQLETVALDHLVLTSGHGRHFIPLDPPMSSWADSRRRMIDMDRAALTGLGRSSITVDRYLPPRGFHAVVMLACVLTYLSFCRQRNFLPGSFLYDRLLYRVEPFAHFCRSIQPLLFPLMVAIHVTEASLFAWWRVSKHIVPPFTGLWWTWVISNFLEGYGAWQRFDGLVRQREREQDAINH